MNSFLMSVENVEGMRIWEQEPYPLVRSSYRSLCLDCLFGRLVCLGDNILMWWKGGTSMNSNDSSSGTELYKNFLNIIDLLILRISSSDIELSFLVYHIVYKDSSFSL